MWKATKIIPRIKRGKEEHEPFEIPTSHPSKYGKQGIREITYQLNQPSPAQERITE
jgi:hypothetical protein